MSELAAFLQDIFPSELLQPDEYVCYSAKADRESDSGDGPAPGLPCDFDGMKRALRSVGQRALYMGTATMRKDPELGLRNQQRLFAGQWLVVLDDIGSGPGAKCPIDDLPPGILDSATYVLETSPDNFQLGFVLAEPIRNIAQAREFTALVYGAGPWDSGGAMPNKYVRLPGSANFKHRYGEYGNRFEARLRREDFDKLYTPDQLLALVNAGVGWEDIVAGVAAKREPRRRRGTAAYKPVQALSLDGVIDPLAEWLHEKGLVLNERYPWLDILCPWADDHTSESPTSTSYSPLGWGYDDHGKAYRWFHCFHDHCADNRTREFIEWAIDMGAPPVAIHDPAAALASRYVFDASGNRWINIVEEPHIEIPDRGFRTLHNDKIWFPKVAREGEVRWGYTSAYNLILDSAFKVAGRRYIPGEDFLFNVGTEHIINTCRLPFYGSGPVNTEDVQCFTDFIEYLMPDPGDAAWFIKHLAAKVQNPRYRGPGIFMYTPTSGTGRGTLQRMLTQLWGTGLVNSTTMPTLLRGLSGEGKNDELESLWVIVPEADDSAAGPRYKSYEHMKSFLEPAPVEMVFDQKWGGRWRGVCYASAIICSNHSDGFILDPSDRRVRRIRNTLRRRGNQYFVDLNAWMQAGTWRASVWRWLEQYDIGDYTGTEPQDDLYDETERDARLATQSPITQGVEFAIEYYTQHNFVFRSGDVMAAFERCQVELGLLDMRNWRAAAKRELQRTSVASPVQIRADGRPTRFRVFARGNGALLVTELQEGSYDAADLRDKLAAADVETLSAYIADRVRSLE